MTDFEKLKRVLEEIGVKEFRCHEYSFSSYSDIEIGESDNFIEFNFIDGKFDHTRVETCTSDWG